MNVNLTMCFPASLLFGWSLCYHSAAVTAGAISSVVALVTADTPKKNTLLKAAHIWTEYTPTPEGVDFASFRPV